MDFHLKRHSDGDQHLERSNVERAILGNFKIIIQIEQNSKYLNNERCYSIIYYRISFLFVQIIRPVIGKDFLVTRLFTNDRLLKPKNRFSQTAIRGTSYY